MRMGKENTKPGSGEKIEMGLSPGPRLSGSPIRAWVWMSGRREMMKTVGFLAIGLILVFCFVSAGVSRNTSPSLSVPFETIDHGEHSLYRYGDPGFGGVDLLIRDKKTWARFWAEHQGPVMNPLPPPPINFRKEMVIVTMLGYQTSGGGPTIKVLEINVNDYARVLSVLIAGNEIPGPLDVITNPFHIIKLKRLDVQSLILEHEKAKSATDNR